MHLNSIIKEYRENTELKQKKQHKTAPFAPTAAVINLNKKIKKFKQLII